MMWDALGQKTTSAGQQAQTNHIRWNGSIRLGSQATVERSIGEMGRKIRSKKAPFANFVEISVAGAKG
jgi:hypothetical protein